MNEDVGLCHEAGGRANVKMYNSGTVPKSLYLHVSIISVYRNMYLYLRLLEQVVRHTPRITTVIAKKLGASHVKNLPPIPPSRGVVLPVCFDQVRPNLLLILKHALEPVFACLGVMSTFDPPFILDSQIILKVEEQVVRWHRAAPEKVSGHPPIFKIVWRRGVRKYVDK